MRTLVIHPGAMGDLILSLPALSCLKRRWPETRITLAASIDFAPPIARSLADDFLSISSLPMAGLFGSNDSPAETVAFWRSFDRVLSWTGASDPEFVRRLNAIHPNALAAPWRPLPGESRHVSELFLFSLSPWIPQPSDCGLPEIRPCQEDEADAQCELAKLGIPHLEGFITIHPGAGNRSKRWPAPLYRQFISTLLQEVRERILVLEGPAEEGIACEIVKDLDAKRIRTMRGASVGTLSGILALSCGYLGNDSGVSHLAAAVGAPSLVLFGPTDPRNWRPLGPGVKVISRKDDCAACCGDVADKHSCLSELRVGAVVREFLASARKWTLPI